MIADAWLSSDNATIEGSRMVTVNRGDHIISGTGYPGTGPGGAAPAAGSAWAYATGPIQVRVGDTQVFPETLPEAMDRIHNKIEYRAERFAAANFDPCCHFAVLVDIADLGGGGGGVDAWDQAEIDELLANTAAAAAPVVLTETALVDDTAYAGPNLYGWSIQNTFAGLSTVYIRLGNSGAATPYIAIDLAENETVTQIFEHPISNATGFFLTVEAGSVTGLLYTTS